MKKLFIPLIAILLTISSFNPINSKVVVIDIGHGGEDHGANANGILEKEITMKIAKRIQDINGDVKIVFTREEDQYVSLKDRVDQINSIAPTCMISIHVNPSENTKKSGFELFVAEKKSKDETSLQLAEQLINTMPVQLEAGTINSANFYILKNSKCPSALIELGYLSNTEDNSYLSSDEGQQAIAKAIYTAIQQF